MATLVTTKCPHCQTKFDIPAAQFADSTAKGRCSNCHKTFFISDHVVNSAKKVDTVESAAPSLTKPQPATVTATATATVQPSKPAKSSANTPAAKEDDLIYDDMELEDEDDIGDIGDGLIYDDMDIDGSRDAASALQELDLDELFDDDTHPTASSSPTFDKPAASAAMSSSAANDIHNGAKAGKQPYTDENSWLEGLLQEKETASTLSKDNNTNNTDLSELLAQMGMESDNTTPTRQAPVYKEAPSKPLPIASILWAIGCVVLALLLFAQYLIFNADSIIKNPKQAAQLQSICAIASCSLPSADLQALTINQFVNRPSQIKDPAYFSDIGADIVNQSTNAQLMPSLQVTIYGDNNALLGDFIAEPENYLLSPQNQMAASSTMPVLFTVPIENRHIKQINIQPLY